MTQLVDLMGRKHTYLRVSVTDRCNLRCTYCMPADGICLKPVEEILTLEEIARICDVFSTLGINKIRLTGGEPLVRRGLVDLARQVSALPGIEHIGVTTNGVLLAPLAADLKAAGINRVNISLDTLKPERFEQIALRPELARVLEGIEAALAVGFATVRLNVVVIAGVNDDEVLDFIEFVRERPISVRFIEFMPVGHRWAEKTPLVPTTELIARIERKYELTPLEQAGGMLNVAKQFRIKGMLGTVGFITSVTEHFCGGCNRMRITPDGQFKTCLHFPAELNLRDAMRTGASDAELTKQIISALQMKREGRPRTEPGESDGTECMERRPMYEIGG